MKKKQRKRIAIRIFEERERNVEEKLSFKRGNNVEEEDDGRGSEGKEYIGVN